MPGRRGFVSEIVIVLTIASASIQDSGNSTVAEFSIPVVDLRLPATAVKRKQKTSVVPFTPSYYTTCPGESPKRFSKGRK